MLLDASPKISKPKTIKKFVPPPKEVESPVKNDSFEM
tara:strand:- start:949 stop:1059 length:111 start_codon:yes stop_codon:yes gene_type:complete